MHGTNKKLPRRIRVAQNAVRSAEKNLNEAIQTVFPLNSLVTCYQGSEFGYDVRVVDYSELDHRVCVLNESSRSKKWVDFTLLRPLYRERA